MILLYDHFGLDLLLPYFSIIPLAPLAHLAPQ